MHRYYNSGEKPTFEVLHKHPELVHRVKWRLGVGALTYHLYNSKWPLWRMALDTVHLLVNHRSYLDDHYEEYPVFNESNIVHHPYTFGEMVLSVWNPNSSKHASV